MSVQNSKSHFAINLSLELLDGRLFQEASVPLPSKGEMLKQAFESAEHPVKVFCCFNAMLNCHSEEKLDRDTMYIIEDVEKKDCCSLELKEPNCCTKMER